MVLLLLTVQCDVIDSDLLDNPNAPSPAQLDPNFLVTNIQLSTRGVYSGAALRGSQLTRQRRLFGATYESALRSQLLNGVYQTAYSSVFVDTQTLESVFDPETNPIYFHVGLAQVLRAYGLITMVDMFGDVPWSEALDASNFNPNVDSGADVYDAAFDLLDEAIGNLTNPDRVGFPVDLYFPGKEGDAKVEAWVRTANTLKLKMYVNMRHVDPARATAGIQALLDTPVENGGGLIDEATHDFTFQFSINDTNPDSRHPLFTNNYLNGANDYIGLSIMHIMLYDKANRDPRLRSYFYRQKTQNTTDVNEQSCLNAFPPPHFTPDDPFCQLEDGYWGNGHLNTEGIPPDTEARTAFGVYPAGGEFDANQARSVRPDLGLQGAGIRPILMSSFTHFLLAEAAQTLNGLNTPLGARGHLEEGVLQSMTTVRAFSQSRITALDADALFTTGMIDSYVAEVLARFDSGGREVRTIAVEMYIASFPNGMEAYNVMRRTGFPSRADGIQPALNDPPGNFYRSLPYPNVLIARNSNVSAKASNLVRVFWDTHGADDEFNF